MDNFSPKYDQFMKLSWTEFRIISLVMVSVLNAVPPHLGLQRSSPSLPEADSESESRPFHYTMAQSCDDNHQGFVIQCQNSAHNSAGSKQTTQI